MPVLIPAYGRVYLSESEAILDYEDGKDFVECTPFGRQYCSCRDFVDETVEIRYGRQRQRTFTYTK